MTTSTAPFLVFILLCSPPAKDAPPRAIPSLPGQDDQEILDVIQIIKVHVHAELDLVEDLAQKGDEYAERLWSALEGPINASARQRLLTKVVSTGPRRIELELQKQLYIQLQQFLGDEVANAYRSDFETRNAFARETTSLALLSIADQALLLTREQRMSVRALIDDNITEDWISCGPSESLLGGSFRDFRHLDSDAMKAILRPVQFKAFAELRSLNDFGVYFFKERIRKDCKRAVDLRIDDIKHQFEIDEFMIRKLGLVGKATVDVYSRQLRKG